jgi:hypothetical protein
MEQTTMTQLGTAALGQAHDICNSFALTCAQLQANHLTIPPNACNAASNFERTTRTEAERVMLEGRQVLQLQSKYSSSTMFALDMCTDIRPWDIKNYQSEVSLSIMRAVCKFLNSESPALFTLKVQLVAMTLPEQQQFEQQLQQRFTNVHNGGPLTLRAGAEFDTVHPTSGEVTISLLFSLKSFCRRCTSLKETVCI